MGFIICEKARSGIEVKTMRLVPDQEEAERRIRMAYRGKWFAYEVIADGPPVLRVTYDFRFRPVGKPKINRYKGGK